MTRRVRTLQIGEISSGTLRTEDLIESLSWDLRRLRMTRADRLKFRAIETEYESIDADSDGATESLCELYQDLSDLAEGYTPDYCYFGASGGDGASIGVWPIAELFEDTRQGSYDGSVHRSSWYPSEAKSEVRAAIAAGRSHWLYVNERGNSTLYRRAGNRWIEVWSVA